MQTPIKMPSTDEIDREREILKDAAIAAHIKTIERYEKALRFIATGQDTTIQSFAKRAVQIARDALTAAKG
jgi:hypothetical protein